MQLSDKSIPNLPIIVVIAVALRLIWIALFPVEPVSDSFAYNLFATNIVEHGVFGFRPEQPGAYWAVGTPAIYAGAYMIFGINSFAVIFVNMLSSLAALWFIYAVGRLYFNEATGRMAALLFALWPVTIQFTTVVASELHFMATMMAGLYFWEKATRGKAFWVNIILSGLCLAAATYIRPIAQLIPVVLLILSVLRWDQPLWRPALKMGLTLIIISAAIAPWSARNERVFGTPVSISTNFGPNFWMGNHPGTGGGYTPLPDWTNNMGEIERAQALKDIAFDYVKDEPVAFVTRTVGKAIKLHNRETIGVVWNLAAIEGYVGTTGAEILKGISSLYWFGAIALSLAAVVTLSMTGQARRAIFTPPLILILYLIAVHAVIVVEDRYHMPQIPLMAILSAVFLTRASFAPVVAVRGDQ